MRWLWIVLLTGFVVLNIYAFATSDLAALWHYVTNPGPWGLVAFADLLIALTIALVWMWRDAVSRRVDPLPYTIVAICTGTPGVLLYLIRHWPTPAATGRSGSF